MHRYELSRQAMRSMRSIPQERKGKIFAALDDVVSLADPTTHQSVKKMKGDRSSCWRLRIGSYRAIFKVVADEKDPEKQLLVLLVLTVGPRGDVYKG